MRWLTSAARGWIAVPDGARRPATDALGREEHGSREADQTAPDDDDGDFGFRHVAAHASIVAAGSDRRVDLAPGRVDDFLAPGQARQGERAEQEPEVAQRDVVIARRIDVSRFTTMPAEPRGDDERPDARREGDEQPGHDLDATDDVHEVLAAPGTMSLTQGAR